MKAKKVNMKQANTKDKDFNIGKIWCSDEVDISLDLIKGVRDLLKQIELEIEGRKNEGDGMK